jgi:hypothetical protein
MEWESGAFEYPDRRAQKNLLQMYISRILSSAYMEYIHIIYECHIIQRVTYIFILTDFFPAFSCTLILQDGNAASSKKINSNWETVFLEYSSNS